MCSRLAMSSGTTSTICSWCGGSLSYLPPFPRRFANPSGQAEGSGSGSMVRGMRTLWVTLWLQCASYVMLSSGGFTTFDAAAQYPFRIIESGPAAGALAAAYYSGLPGSIDPTVVAFDMGGTTAKICLVEAGRPRLSTVFEA